MTDLALDREYDARGMLCPLPVLRARRLLAGMAPGALLGLRADDPMARIDMPHFCSQAGHDLISAEEQDGALLFVIRRGARTAPAEDHPAEA